jgi:hypothetical protein
MRFLAPMLPAVAWLAALGLTTLPRLRAHLSLLLAARMGLATVLLLRLFLVDSRLQAARWVVRNVPRGSTLDLITNNPGYAPRLPPGWSYRQIRTLSREMAPDHRFAAVAERYPREASEWLVLTASYYERFLDHPRQKPLRAAFFGELLAGERGFAVVARFRQQGWLRPQAEFLDPEIVILRRRRPQPPEPG